MNKHQVTASSTKRLSGSQGLPQHRTRPCLSAAPSCAGLFTSPNGGMLQKHVIAEGFTSIGRTRKSAAAARLKVVVAAAASGAPGAEEGTVAVRFSIELQCNFGEVVKLVGSHPAAGGGDVATAPLMQWTEGHVWVLQLALPPGTALDFQFARQSGSGTTWEASGSRMLRLPRRVLGDGGEELGGVATADVTCSWETPEGTTVQYSVRQVGSGSFDEMESQSPWPPVQRPASSGPGSTYSAARTAPPTGDRGNRFKQRKDSEGGAGAVPDEPTQDNWRGAAGAGASTEQAPQRDPTAGSLMPEAKPLKFRFKRLGSESGSSLSSGSSMDASMDEETQRAQAAASKAAGSKTPSTSPAEPAAGVRGGEADGKALSGSKSAEAVDKELSSAEALAAAARKLELTWSMDPEDEPAARPDAPDQPAATAATTPAVEPTAAAAAAAATSTPAAPAAPTAVPAAAATMSADAAVPPAAAATSAGAVAPPAAAAAVPPAVASPEPGASGLFGGLMGMFRRGPPQAPASKPPQISWEQAIAARAPDSMDLPIEIRAAAGGDAQKAAEVAAGLERLFTSTQEKINGVELRALVVAKWGVSYDMQLHRQNQRMYFQVMWKHLEQQSFPMSEEEYMEKVAAIADCLSAWGSVEVVRNGISTAKGHPGYTVGGGARAISIPLGVDLDGARKGEWSRA